MPQRRTYCVFCEGDFQEESICRTRTRRPSAIFSFHALIFIDSQCCPNWLTSYKLQCRSIFTWLTKENWEFIAPTLQLEMLWVAKRWINSKGARLYILLLHPIFVLQLKWYAGEMTVCGHNVCAAQTNVANRGYTLRTTGQNNSCSKGLDYFFEQNEMEYQSQHTV